MWKLVELFRNFQLWEIGCFAFDYKGKGKL